MVKKNLSNSIKKDKNIDQKKKNLPVRLPIKLQVSNYLTNLALPGMLILWTTGAGSIWNLESTIFLTRPITKNRGKINIT